MSYEINNLYKGIFLKRYKRFFIDFLMNQNLYTAHCPNTGSMTSCLEENSEILISKTESPKRKLSYTLELIKPKDWVFVNTLRTNSLFENFLKTQKEFIYQFYIKEPRFPLFRPDFLLFNENYFHFLNSFGLVLYNKKFINSLYNFSKPLLIEIKNVTYFIEKEDCLVFPDAKTKRGSKHIEKLIYYLHQGFDCMICFVLSRSNGSYFRIASEIDKEFTNKLYKFFNLGGRIYTLRLSIYIENKQKENIEDITAKIKFTEFKNILL